MCMTKNQWMLVGGAIVLLVLLAVFLVVKKPLHFLPVGGRDTPIVIAGGSIHGHCDVHEGCAEGWTPVLTESRSYQTKLLSPIKQVLVTENNDPDDPDDPDEPGRPEDPPINSAISLKNAGDDWSVEIDTSVPGANTSIAKVIKIAPLLGTNGKTLKITFNDNEPYQHASWDLHGSKDLRFHGNSGSCVARPGLHDPLGHCDALVAVQVTLSHVAQPLVICRTSVRDGKCKIKLQN